MEVNVDVVWVWYGLNVLAIFGLAFALSRKGLKIKSDTQTKPPPDMSRASLM